METNRRQFMAIAGATVLPIVAASSTTSAAPTSQESAADGVVDVGLLSSYKQDGVYSDFREAGVLVIRRNRQLFALSSICTHRGCKVRAQQDQSFVCKCHGSTFDPDGRVTKPPATGDLPRLAIAQTADDRILVHTKRTVLAG
jgi:cytochrome b6-f complex iron-sulfur subunit